MTKKLLIVSTTIMLLFSMFAGLCYADEELASDNQVEEQSNTSSITSSTPKTIDDPSYKSSSATVSSVNRSNLAEANLGLNNILCIILISIGVLLILFAIAILIRLS